MVKIRRAPPAQLESSILKKPKSPKKKHKQNAQSGQAGKHKATVIKKQEGQLA